MSLKVLSTEVSYKVSNFAIPKTLEFLKRTDGKLSFDDANAIYTELLARTKEMGALLGKLELDLPQQQKGERKPYTKRIVIGRGGEVINEAILEYGRAHDGFTVRQIIDYKDPTTQEPIAAGSTLEAHVLALKNKGALVIVNPNDPWGLPRKYSVNRAGIQVKEPSVIVQEKPLPSINEQKRLEELAQRRDK